eukprot:CAMPEP_0172445132 /NCGR_PEP_ID=MMETSP1065-20121228/5068_1 /TAXON_ID=265537 /ORGANISM="Amphiprora paludosa, Strain CCMP125" /LENGTH=405 /DNA_ID=CAMNT_0013195927 /DNA_START=137 /DNA_END=1354 /DNA_ORIENTATION=+
MELATTVTPIDVAESSPVMDDESLSPLSLSFDELSSTLGGRGRAKLVWESLRQGVDPLDGFMDETTMIDSNSIDDKGHSNPPLLGQKAKNVYLSKFGGRIQDCVSSVSEVKISNDNTTKMLLHLHKDGLEVETVIIPWEDRQKSTLCISSQVGCRQGCTFCMTGRMGKLRSLSADEILSQVFHAVAATQSIDELYPIDNVVFMGMGEPADNVDAVLVVANALANSNQFQLAARRITISTVAPNPQTFAKLAQAPAVLAWSVHASQDELRQQLVPTTRNTMQELRRGLIEALQQRSRRLQSIMLEVTLLNGINDRIEDANHLADFCFPIIKEVPHTKLVINIIPWNDISATSGPAMGYQKPSEANVLAFQQQLVRRGLRCYVRTTRGDDSDAACGQLATKKSTKLP